MKKLSQKDKKMLILLGVFLIGLGYYEFIVSPLYNKSKLADATILKKKKELVIVKTKIAGYRNLSEKYNKMLNAVNVAAKNSIMPNVEVPLETKIKAIMTAADLAYIKIKSIKPMNYIKEGVDGKPIIIKDKFFSIEGSASAKNFLSFLRNLWGTKLESLNLSSFENNGNGGDIRYFIKIEFLNKNDSPFLNKDELGKLKKYKDFKLMYSPFEVIKPPPPPPPPRPKGPIAKPKPKPIVHSISGFELIGIADLNNKMMAIIDDKQKNKVLYIKKGDDFRGAVVKEITDTTISFYFEDNKQTIEEKLKVNGLKLAQSDTSKNSSVKKKNDNRRKGHLGIMVETFTQDIANRYSLEFNPGLFVISPGRHRNIFKKHDVIIEINDRPVPNFEAALRVMSKVYVGDKIKIELKRAGRERSFSYVAD